MIMFDFVFVNIKSTFFLNNLYFLYKFLNLLLFFFNFDSFD